MPSIRTKVRVNSRLATDDIISFRRAIHKADGRMVARRAAKYVAKAMEQSPTPRSKKDHSYKRKGGERILIKSGNLQKSTKIFSFPKSSRLHVGPRVLNEVKGGQLGNSKPRSSGFYARWIIEGKYKGRKNDYMRKIYDNTSDVTRALLSNDWEIALDRVADRALKKGITRWEKYYSAKGRS